MVDWPFQSTSPQGERHTRYSDIVMFLGVSIHVPTRGTTDRQSGSLWWTGRFNPRPHKGNDDRANEVSDRIEQFQSTSPQGERPIWEMGPNNNRRVSIHVPTRGTTDKDGIPLFGWEVSIHVPTRGTTFPVNIHDNSFQRFNPRPHKGNDSKIDNFFSKYLVIFT